jgi:ABC-type cobalamin transport system permease subunit
MHMLGTVTTHLTRMATWLKNHWSAMELKKKWLSLTIGVWGISQTIQSVMLTLLALTKQNKEQLLVQSRTLLDLLMSLVTTFVKLSLGVGGLLVHLIVSQIHRVVLKLQSKGQ